MTFGIIYKATNLTNGKAYIGQTIHSLKRRRAVHERRIKTGPRAYFHNALKKNGKESFIWETICSADSGEELDKKEIFYIAEFNSFGIGGYNLTSGGSGICGWKRDRISAGLIGREFTKEHKNNMSISMRAAKVDRTGSRNPMYGRKHSPEAIAKMREKKLGKAHPMYGRKHSPETIEKMTAARRKRL